MARKPKTTEEGAEAPTHIIPASDASLFVRGVLVHIKANQPIRADKHIVAALEGANVPYETA